MEKITKVFLQARLEAGATHKDIAALTGLGRGQVYELLRHHGLSRGRRGAPPKLPPVIEIVARLERGEHPKTIAAGHGVTTTAVYRACERAGVEVRDHSRFPIARGAHRKLPVVREIVRRIEAGEHPRDIAAEAGVTASAVHTALQREGLSARDIREGRHLALSRRRGRFGFPDYAFALKPGHGLGCEMSRAEIIAGDGYWRNRLAAGDYSIAVTDALREIAEAKEAQAVDDMIFRWLGDLLLDDRLNDLDRLWKGAR